MRFTEKPPPLLDIVPESGMNEKLDVVNKKEFKMAESPSAGTVASARGLALLAAAMADQGQVGNYETAINQKFRVTISSAKNLLKYCLFDCQGPRGRPATDVRRDVELDARGADQAQNLSVSRDQLQPGRSQLLWVSGLLLLYYRYSAARMRGPRSTVQIYQKVTFSSAAGHIILRLRGTTTL